MCSSGERRWIDFPTDIDESTVDANLISEWDQLAGKEYELELAVDRVKDAVHQAHNEYSWNELLRVNDTIGLDEISPSVSMP